MSQERRAKQLRQLFFHAEFGANYPAADRSRKTVEGMNPSPRERRRYKRYEKYKLEKLSNIEKENNRKYLKCDVCGKKPYEGWKAGCQDPYHDFWKD